MGLSLFLTHAECCDFRFEFADMALRSLVVLGFGDLLLNGFDLILDGRHSNISNPTTGTLPRARAQFFNPMQSKGWQVGEALYSR
jgi:hypothetical protein